MKSQRAEELCEQVALDFYKQTRMKISPDDPLITMAVYHASLIREAVAGIEDATDHGVRRVEECIQRGEKSLQAKVAEALKGAVIGTFPIGSREGGPSLAFAVLGMALVVAMAGVMGALFFPKLGLSAEQKANLARGAALAKILPQLDTKTRARIDAAIQEEAK